MLSIGPEDILRALPMSKCIEAMQRMYFYEGNAIKEQPVRSLFRINKDSLIFVMPGYSELLRRFSVKIVSEFKDNPRDFGLPSQGGRVMLFDTRNSEPLALLDSPTLTSIRTGAVSGLATKILAKKTSSFVGVIGSGQQARSILEAVSTVRKISSARVYSPNSLHADRFAEEMSEKLGTEVLSVKERKLATKETDIILVATNSYTPVLSWKDVPEGCHVNSVGTLPERRELDDDTIGNSKLFVDYREGVLTEAGDVIHAIGAGAITEDHIKGDISELVHALKSGRESEEQVTIFKSVGFALQDVYAANYVYEVIKSEK